MGSHRNPPAGNDFLVSGLEHPGGWNWGFFKEFPTLPKKPSVLTPRQVEIVQTLRQRAPRCIVSQVRIQNQGFWDVPEYPGVQSHLGEWDLRGRKTGEARAQVKASG